jgi:hypothetical protein
MSLWTHTWLKRMTKLTGRTPILYTNVSFWRDGELGRLCPPLWLASYGVSKPAVVGGWKSYTFWQYTETGKLAGAGPKTDLSVFNGSLAQLEAMTTTAASPAAAAAGPAAAAAAADAMTLKYTTRGTTTPADATRGAVTSSRSDLRLWLGVFGMDGSRTIAGH